ncbi:hypothetical protein GLYMA_02G103000v4 [Glycine max]|uniref:Uncharacterized protein n=1 Tax=Glycine max TaxID=3847 RepID=A0A0R0L0I0_SOYBN|nr:hypothetical protein JHK87_003575 [Glycine soja]KAG5062702.1 hypothetical protein JHK85_003885 [Glycine max]KAG5079651.1 hypothetical protein JHK86_003716 [Glycine max]KAH1059675.1 hypothetical protein GYH30_003601 [Glycine max]KRH70658.1 hypothetical protein GLYMA_02G103000v4 [Glycine max]
MLVGNGNQILVSHGCMGACLFVILCSPFSIFVMAISLLLLLTHHMPRGPTLFLRNYFVFKPQGM